MKDDFKPAAGPAKSLRAMLDERLAETQTPQVKSVTVAEKVAEDEHVDMEVDMAAPQPGTPAEPPGQKTGWRQKLNRKLNLKWPPGRKEWIIIGVAVVLVAGGVFFVTHHRKKPTVPAAKIIKINKPVIAKTVPSNLTGLPVDPAVNQRQVTAAMIENSQDARPQSGLSEAGVVFEAIAEGGITRFLALFQDTAPGSIGPVRSARPYYLQWELGFDAGYAHVGGSPEALADIKAWGAHDLDQFANGGSYQRIASRAAPHNVYTSIGTLNQLEAGKGQTTSTYVGFVRKKKEAPVKVPTAKTIDLNISGALYNVHYDYDAVHNRYLRSEGGAPHIDANNNQQIAPKVVIAMVMSYGLEADDHHSAYGVIGSGQAFIFQDGAVATGNWTKADNTSQIKFTDAAGNPIPLTPGQTWLTALADPGRVTYAP